MEAWSMLGGALVMHLVSVAIGEPIEPAAWTSPEAIGALAYLSVGASAVGFLIYFDLLERLGAVEINMVSYVAPVVTAVVGWLYLDEVVDTATLAGFASSPSASSSSSGERFGGKSVPSGRSARASEPPELGRRAVRSG